MEEYYQDYQPLYSHDHKFLGSTSLSDVALNNFSNFDYTKNFKDLCKLVDYYGLMTMFDLLLKYKGRGLPAEIVGVIKRMVYDGIILELDYTIFHNYFEELFTYL